MPIEDISEDDQLRWWIACTDGTEEDQRVTVLVMGDRVALVLPPSDIMVFEPDEAGDLADLLDKAAGYAVIAH